MPGRFIPRAIQNFEYKKSPTFCEEGLFHNVLITLNYFLASTSLTESTGTISSLKV